jgi:hypothetical protein
MCGMAKAMLLIAARHSPHFYLSILLTENKWKRRPTLVIPRACD